MARATRIFTINAVADHIDEDVALIELISCNPDNIDYGEMVHIHDGSEDGATGFTDRGVECIRELLADIRTWKGGLRGFLVSEHCEPEVIEQIMEKEQVQIDAQDGTQS